MESNNLRKLEERYDFYYSIECFNFNVNTFQNHKGYEKLLYILDDLRLEHVEKIRIYSGKFDPILEEAGYRELEIQTSKHFDPSITINTTIADLFNKI